MNKKAKKVTLNTLAKGLGTLAEKTEGLAESMEDLARMTAKGFENTAADSAKLGQGLEEVKLRLDNVAYRFEVKDLEKRVERLEIKAKIQHHR